MSKSAATRPSKPTLKINLDIPGAEPGGIVDVLERVEESRSYHKEYDLRPPLGIYNVSVQRLNQRVARAANALAAYTMRVRSMDDRADPEEIALISDTLEGCIYAAAEHVDDIENCLRVLFPDQTAFAKSKAVREFKKSLAPIRRNVSAYANAIKHVQARIRLFRFGFIHSGQQLVLTGFFVEGVKDGVVGPSETVHGSDDKVIAVGALLWEVIVFVHLASDLLIRALKQILEIPLNSEPDRDRDPILTEGVLATARLPLIALDGPHPFDIINVNIVSDTTTARFSATDLYGSLGNGWTRSRSHEMRGMEQDYVGDGVSRSFQLAQPKTLRLLHWTQGVAA